MGTIEHYHAVRAILVYRFANFLDFERVFQSCLPFLCNFWHFCSLLNGFEHFPHLFFVLIFQASSFANAIL